MAQVRVALLPRLELALLLRERILLHLELALGGRVLLVRAGDVLRGREAPSEVL